MRQEGSARGPRFPHTHAFALTRDASLIINIYIFYYIYIYTNLSGIFGIKIRVKIASNRVKHFDVASKKTAKNGQKWHFDIKTLDASLHGNPDVYRVTRIFGDDDFARLGKVVDVLLAVPPADELRLARQLVLREPLASGLRQDLQDALLRLLVRRLRHVRPHDADDLADQVAHELRRERRLPLADDGPVVAARDREDERNAHRVLRRLAVEVVRLVAAPVRRHHPRVDLVAERGENRTRRIVRGDGDNRRTGRGGDGRGRADGILPGEHLAANRVRQRAQRLRLGLRARLRDEEEVAREPAVAKVVARERLEQDLRLGRRVQAEVGVLHHDRRTLLAVARHALLALPTSVGRGPQLQQGGLDGVLGRALRVRVRHAAEVVPRLVDERNLPRLPLERPLDRRVARDLPEPQLRRAALVQDARDDAQGRVLAARGVADRHHEQVRALPVLALHTPPVQDARERKRRAEREQRLRAHRRLVDEVHHALDEAARMGEVGRKVVVNRVHCLFLSGFKFVVLNSVVSGFGDAAEELDLLARECPVVPREVRLNRGEFAGRVGVHGDEFPLPRPDEPHVAVGRFDDVAYQAHVHASRKALAQRFLNR